jgi:hypothetical protein
MTNDELIRKLQITLSEVDRIFGRYDPEHDLIPNAPRVTHTDSVALEAITAIGGVVMELVKALAVAGINVPSGPVDIARYLEDPASVPAFIRRARK